MYTLLRMLAPCLASALSRYHPGWEPTPRTPPRGTPPPTPPGTPTPTTHPTPPHPTPASPSGRLLQVDGYSEWMVIPMTIPMGFYCSMGLRVATPLSPTARGIWWLQCPTPPHTPLVRVEGYSKWMVIPSGWLFRVHGYSVGSYFNSNFESNKQGRAQAQSMQKALIASVGHCTFCPATTRRRL